jgi:uncharacterized protein
MASGMRKPRPLDLHDLRVYAIVRSLGSPATLLDAIERLGFVQADPIRAPARAQDLILRQRVVGYRAGDLEGEYPGLPLEEDHVVNYGFLPRRHLGLIHPRGTHRPWDRAQSARAVRIRAFVRERGEVHPRDVEARFGHGTVTNYWGGQSNATTRLLEEMHFRGQLRVARREAGVRVYAAPGKLEAEPRTPAERAAALFALAFGKYAPMPASSIGPLASRLRYAVPDLASELRQTARRAVEDLPHARVDGVEWYWPAGEDPRRTARPPDEGLVRLLAPFDPIVWDRRRFEAFWGWAYRFEAYTPVAKRRLGYYALPLLFRRQVIGWANIAAGASEFAVDLGWVAGRPPTERALARGLEAEIERMRAFLGVAHGVEQEGWEGCGRMRPQRARA